MTTKLQKWGNSQGVRLPRELIEAAGISVGAELELSTKDGEITIRPLLPVRPVRGRYRISDLVASIPPGPKPKEIDWGNPRGEEVW